MLMDEAVHRVPALAETGIRKFYNGPESFTPDNQFLLGRAPELDNCFVGAGFNSVGIASAGGAGPGAGRVGRRRGADVRPDGCRRTPVRARSTADPRSCATGSRRCSACTTRSRGRTASRDRARRPALAAALAAGRGRRRLRLQDGLGAAQRLRTDARRGPRLLVGQAVLAALVRGRAAGHPRGGRGLRPDLVLQVRRRRAVARSRRCSGSAPPTSTSPVGHCVYTPWLNERGSYEADLTVTRDGPDSLLGRLVVRHHGARPRLAAPARRRRGR